MTQSRIRWTSKQLRELEKAINKYNSEVTSMEQSGLYDVTPNRTTLTRERNLIETRQELARRVDELSRITEDSASNIVDMNGVAAPQYLRDEIGNTLDSINERRRNQREEILSGNEDILPNQEYTMYSNKNLADLNGVYYTDGDDLDVLLEEYYPQTYKYAELYKEQWEQYNGDPMVSDVIDYMAENYPDELNLIFESGDDEVEINYIYSSDKSSDKSPEVNRHKNIKDYWNEVYHTYHGGNHPDYEG